MSSFVFQWPLVLLLLLGALPLAWLIRRAQQQKAQTRVALGHGKGPARGERRDWLWVLFFLFLVLALARPGYSPKRHSITNTGRDVVFVLDVSRSMLARDAYPSRLESAKQAIADCLDTLGSEQVGLVIYGGSASISCPLSSDYDFVRYMLSRVQPRSVDFGGTFLLSAIEKTVDQVLDSERAGFQDVIVLTDGEDHAPNLDTVVERVKESSVSLLVIGLGNAEEGAPIPVENEDGATSSLSFEGEIIYTVQQKEALATLAKSSLDSEYVNAGVQPYHLGDIYQRFAEGKPSAAMDGDSGYTVYQEGAFYLLPLALLFAVLAHPLYWKGAFRVVPLLAVAFGALGNDADGQELDFGTASQLFEDKKFEEAGLAFQTLMQGESAPGAVAALSFNRGLATLKRVEQTREASPREALSLALAARESFLLAAREKPDFRRAQLRISGLAQLIATLEKAVREEDQQEQEQDDRMKELLGWIESLLKQQVDLRNEEVSLDPARSAKRGKNVSSSDIAETEPADSAKLSSRFAQSQGDLERDGERIRKAMQELNVILEARFKELDAPAGLETILSTPLRLMGEAIEAQGHAVELLALWQNWPSARSRQEVVEERLQEILDLFASDQSDEGDEEDWDEYEDYEMGEEGEAMPSSMAMEGDLKANAEMQELPLPNYSPEEILMEEMGSQQFRQEQRAKSNAGKVERDW